MLALVWRMSLTNRVSNLNLTTSCRLAVSKYAETDAIEFCKWYALDDRSGDGRYEEKDKSDEEENRQRRCWTKHGVSRSPKEIPGGEQFGMRWLILSKHRAVDVP